MMRYLCLFAILVVGLADIAIAAKKVEAPADKSNKVATNQQGLSKAQQPPTALEVVSLLMTGAGQGLATGQSGQPVQLKQQKAVELLGRLIEAVEKMEQQQKQGKKDCKACQGKGCKLCGGGKMSNKPPKSPAKQSMLPGGSSDIGRLERPPPVRPGQAWGNMRPAEREKILQSMDKQLPSRYRPLVEQYYKQLGKER